MARSVGEAIATGLESGITLGMRIVDAQDQRERRAAEDARLEQERATLRRRQERTDRAAAIKGQREALAAEITAAERAGTPLPPARQVAIQQAERDLTSEQQRIFVEMGGPDIEQYQRRLDQSIAAAREGKLDAGALPGPEFGAVIAHATGFSPRQFLRGANGEPSEIEAAGMRVQAGLAQNNQAETVAGLNVLLRPQIERIVGKPSPHGGKIVGAQIERLHLDPRAPQDRPAVVPMLKVWVNTGKNLQGPPEPGAPPGADSFYLAPVTDGRETGPDATVKSIPVDSGMDFIGNLIQLAEQLNTPEGKAKIDEAYATPGGTPDDWLATRARLGVAAPAGETVQDTVVPRGATLVRQRKDAKGNPIGQPQTLIQPETPAPATREGRVQQTISAIDAQVESGDLDPEVAKSLKRALLTREATGQKQSLGGGAAGGGRGAGGGGGGGGEGISTALNRELTRKLEEIKSAEGEIDRKVDNARTRLASTRSARPREPDMMASDTQRAEYQEELRQWRQDMKDAQAEFDRINRDTEDERRELRARREAVRNQLDRGNTPKAAPPPPGVSQRDRVGKPTVMTTAGGSRVTRVD